MTLIQAIVLAIVQGVTEFLPISSTAHLVLVPWLLGWTDQGLTFDIALHAGTLVAVLAYFAREWLGMTASLFGGSSGVPSVDRRTLGIIVAATVPGGLAGYFLESYAESVFRSPVLIAAHHPGRTESPSSTIPASPGTVTSVTSRIAVTRARLACSSDRE